MPREPMHSQLPLASVRTESGVTIAPRLELDDVQLPDALEQVLPHCIAAPGRSGETPPAPSGEHGRAGVAADTLDTAATNSWLMLVDFSAGSTALGGSLLVQTLLPNLPGRLEPRAPAADAGLLRALQPDLRDLAARGAILAARRRDRGGLVGCLVAMAGPGCPDLAINIDPLLIEGYGDGRMDSGEAKNWTTQVSGLRHELTLRALFNEAPGLVLQVADARRADVMRALRRHGLGRNSHFIAHVLARTGEPAAGAGHASRFSIWRDAQAIFSAPLATLRGSGKPRAAPPQ